MIIRASKFILRLIAALLAVAVLLFAAAAWRLSGGPVSLSFLTPYVGEILSDSDVGLRATVDDTVLTWNTADRTLGIRAVNVRLTRANGQLLAKVPTMAFRLSVRALLRGRLAPTSIDILGIRATALRQPDGHFDFGLAPRGDEVGADAADTPPGDAGAAAPADDLLSLLVSEMSKPAGHGFAGYLTRVSILDADLALEDRRLGVTWRAQQANLLLWREASGVRGDLRLGSELGGRLTRLVATGHFDRETRGVTLEAHITDLVPAGLASLAEVFAPLQGFTVPVDGVITLAASSDGRVEQLGFDLRGGKGEVVLPQLAMPPVVVRSFTVRGAATDDFQRIRFDAAQLETADFTATAAGTLDVTAAGIGIALEASVPTLRTDALPRYWPAATAVNARDWVLSNISGGNLHDIRLHAALTPGEVAGAKIRPGALTVDFGLAGEQVRYFGPLPLLTDAAGSARLTAQHFSLTGVTGRVGDLRVSDGKVDITALDEEDQDAIISLKVAGPATAALTLLDRPPLHFISPLGVTPASVSGQTVISAKFMLPLRKDLTFANVGVQATADLHAIALPKVADRFALSQGELSLQVDKTRLAMQGTAALNDVPVHLEWQETFAPKGPFSSHYVLSGLVDEPGRRALGYPTAPYLNGPTAVTLTIDSGRRGDARIDGRLDLRQARLDFDDLYWHKPAGGAGEATFRFDIPAKGPAMLTDLQLNAGDLHVRGQGQFNKGDLEQLRLPLLHFGRNDLAVRVSRLVDGGYAVAADGASFDLAPFLDDTGKAAPAAGGTPASPGPSLHLSGQVQRVWLDPQHALDTLKFDALRQKDRWEKVNAEGRLPGGAPISLSLKREGPRRALLVSSSDAGAVAQATGLSDNIVGGTFNLQASLKDDLPEASADGRMLLQNFKVIKAPALARLLTVASLSGITEILSGEGIGFIRTEVPFVMTGSKITIHDARGHGGALGFTLDGAIDRAADTANLNGTLVPSYTLNTVLGNIPLLGNILTSRPGEGVFGITYRITGKLSDPAISVNPLSALAPGILRRMFQLGTGDGTTSDEAPASGPPGGPGLPKDYSGTKIPSTGLETPTDPAPNAPHP